MNFSQWIGPIIAIGVFYFIHLIVRRIQLQKDHSFVQKIRLELQNIVDCLEPIAVVGRDLKFQRVNDQFREWLGLSYNDIIGQDVKTVMKFENLLLESQIIRCFEQAEENSTSTIEVPQIPLMIMGQERMIRIRLHEIHLSSFENGEQQTTQFVLIQLHDITEQQLALAKNQEQEIQIREDYFRIHEMSRELETHKNQLEYQMAERDEELLMARNIQRGLLPQNPELPNMKIWSTYMPMSSVGGDYYDIIPLNDKLYGIFIADVAGHGLAAAFVGALTKMSLVLNSKNCKSTAELIEELNANLEKVIHTGHFVTAFFAIYDIDAGLLQYSRAGHPAPVILRQGELIKLETRGLILGAFPNAMAGQDEIQLIPGDRLFLFTDGCFERKMIGRSKERFKYAHFLDFIQKNGHQSMDLIYDLIEENMAEMGEGLEKHEDDYTFIALEYNP